MSNIRREMGDSNCPGHGCEFECDVPSTVSLVLESQPSCLEFSRSSDLLVVGTYNLVPGQESGSNLDENATAADTVPVQERTGSLLVFKTTEKAATLLQTKVLPYAILDLHFSPNDSSTFTVATSVGTLCLFSIDLEQGSDLKFVRSIKICDPSILVLAFSYKGSAEHGKPSVIAVSLSNGHLAVLDEQQDGKDVITIPAHGFEAWAVAWSKAPITASMPGGILYSGGDDSIFCKHDAKLPSLHQDVDGEDPQEQAHGSLIRERKTHTAGITAILPLGILDHSGEEILITGSFDDHIRIISLSSGRAHVFAHRNLGGGVWRISHPFFFHESAENDEISFRVLASCMHAGARVLEIRKQGDASSPTWSIDLIAKFTEHKSMNYASDVKKYNGNFTFASCSFYDRRLCVWNLRRVTDPTGNDQPST